MIAIFLLGSFVYLGSKAQENGDNHIASQGGTASASMASSRSYSVQHGSQHPGSVLPKISLLLCGQRGTLGKLRPGLLETGVWCVRCLAPSTPYKWSGILLSRFSSAQSCSPASRRRLSTSLVLRTRSPSRWLGHSTLSLASVFLKKWILCLAPIPLGSGTRSATSRNY